MKGDRLVLWLGAGATLAALVAVIVVVVRGRVLDAGPVVSSQELLAEARSTQDENATGHEHATDLLVTAEGLVVLCNTNSKGAGEYDAWTLVLGDGGRLVREATLGGRHEDEGRALATLAGGDLVVVGSEVVALSAVGRIWRLGAEGRVGMDVRHGGGRIQGWEDVAALPDGSFVAAGTQDRHRWLARLDRGGRVLWERRDGGPLPETVNAMARTTGGALVVAGHVEVRSLTSDGWLLAVDEQGRTLWERRLGAASDGELHAVAALPDGGFATVGWTERAPRQDRDLWVARFDAAGVPLWVHALGEPGKSESGSAVAALPDGGLAIAGAVVEEPDGRDLGVFRLTPDGEIAWQRTYGGSGWDYATAVAARADGGLFVAGSTMSKGAGKTDVWVLSLGPGGDVAWDRTFGGP